MAEAEMSILETVVEWTPPEYLRKYGYKKDGIHLSILGDCPPAGEYMRSSGAAYTCVRNMSRTEAEKYVLLLALKLIIKEGLNPDCVHNAFLPLQEYRDASLMRQFADPCGLHGML